VEKFDLTADLGSEWNKRDFIINNWNNSGLYYYTPTWFGFKIYFDFYEHEKQKLFMGGDHNSHF